MSQVQARQLSTFKVAHRYRCHGLLDRDTFLSFQKTFEEVVDNIVTKRDSDEKLWAYVRTLFAIDDYADCIPINAANLSIIFDPVLKCMNAMAFNWNRDISIQKRSQPFVYTIQAARELIASQLKTEPENIALLRNGSDPNGNLSNGLDFGAGDNVVVWDENHPTGGVKTWEIRQLRWPNINIVVVTLKAPLTEDNIVKAFTDKVDGKTKFVCFSEVSHLSGTKLPAKKLCQAIHKKNAKTHVHVDGAQAWGAMEHDVVDMECDSYSGGSHKWFLGPKETGHIYIKQTRAVQFWPKDIGYNGEMHEPPLPLPKDASRFEMIGQRNDTNLIGLLYTADIMGLIGFDKIEHRLESLVFQLREGLKIILGKYAGSSPPFVIETPADFSLGILVIKFKDFIDPTKPILSTALYNVMYEDYKIAVSTKKGNRMRFSPHIYNTEDHIKRCLDIIAHELPKLLNFD